MAHPGSPERIRAVLSPPDRVRFDREYARAEHEDGALGTRERVGQVLAYWRVVAAALSAHWRSY